MSGAVVAMLVSAWIVEGTLDAARFALFTTATAVAGLLAFLAIRSAEQTPSATASTLAH